MYTHKSVGQRQSFKMGIWQREREKEREHVQEWDLNFLNLAPHGQILLTKSRFHLFWGSWRILLSSVHCGGKHLCTYQAVSPGEACRLSTLFRPATILRAVLKYVKLSFTCLLLCLEEETRCQEQFGETAQWQGTEKPQSWPCSLPLSHKLCFQNAEVALWNEI